MADLPIIFSAPMVLALLDGRKTQTRRIPTPTWRKLAPGDRLYVRENFARVPASAYRMSDGVQQTIDPTDPDFAVIYAAGWERSAPKWKPCIHLPRWASRLTLVVTATKMEPLQAISEDDAKAEGIGEPYLGDGDPPFEEPGQMISRWQQYRNLWNKLHGAGSWDTNPEVIALTFTAHKVNIDQMAKEAA
jgi:hypothetical protein